MTKAGPGGPIDHKNESFIRIGSDYVVFEAYSSNPAGTSYIRLLNEKGQERTYWNSLEWSEDEVQAEEVMGAIFGRLKSFSAVLQTRLRKLDTIISQLSAEHAEIHPDKGDAPTFNEGGIGWEAKRIIKSLLE